MKKSLRVTLIVSIVIIIISVAILIFGPTTIQLWNGNLRFCSKDGVLGNMGNPIPYPCCSGTQHGLCTGSICITDGGYACGK